MSFKKIASCLFSAFILCCSGAMAQEKVAAITVQSPDFAAGALIPRQYSGDGKDISPDLVWSRVPAQTKSVAVTCTDPDAPGGVWWHWIIFNLSADRQQIKGGQPQVATSGDGTIQGTNDFGKIGYNGPAPPKGPIHHYHFTVYALDNKLELRPGCKKQEFSNAVAGHIIARGEYVGTFVRR